MKRTALIAGAVLLAVAALVVHFRSLPPEGIEPLGEQVTVAWISLAVAVVFLLTALVGLVQKIIEARKATR